MRANQRNSGRDGRGCAIRINSPGSGRAPGVANLAAAIMLALGVTASVEAKVFTVTNASDSGPGTLRQAVLDASATVGHQKIKFSLPAGTTIGLTSGEIKFSGPDITVQGPGRGQLTISGSHSSRIFEVQGNTAVTISDVSLRDGLALGDDSNNSDQRGGAILVGIPTGSDITGPPPAEVPSLVLRNVGIYDSQAFSPNDGGGGAVFMQNGALTIDHSVMDGNFARRNGGAVTTRRGVVQITDSQFTNNTADVGTEELSAEGGGVFVNRSRGAIARSVIRGNELTDVNAVGGAGAGAGLTVIVQFDAFRVESTEISDNRSTEMPFSIGGGARCRDEGGGTSPTLTLINSTISGNVGNYGVGLEAGCNIALVNTTIANNTSTNYYGDGGRPGIEAYSPNAVGQVQLTIVGSLIAGNLGGGSDLGFYHFDGYADPTFVGSNALVQSPESNVALPADTIIGVDPLLGPLAYNGGPTRTHALHPASVAVDAGANPQGLRFDQRGPGFPRVIGFAADIGAFEFDPDRVFWNGFE